MKEENIMANIFDGKMVFKNIPVILKSLPVTLELTAFALVIGLLLGSLIALIRIAKVPVLSRIAVFFVSFLRGTPILVQLYASYFGIPIMLKYINYYHGTNFNINGIPGIVFAALALGLNQSAFDSEIIRSAIQSVDRGQLEAGHSMGMSSWQIFWRITFPQAGQIALLPLGNSLISLIKGTSLAFTCAVVEMTAEGKIIAGSNYRYFEVYLSLGIIYWVITIVLENIIKFIEKRITIPAEAPETSEALVREIELSLEA